MTGSYIRCIRVCMYVRVCYGYKAGKDGRKAEGSEGDAPGHDGLQVEQVHHLAILILSNTLINQYRNNERSPSLITCNSCRRLPCSRFQKLTPACPCMTLLQCALEFNVGSCGSEPIAVGKRRSFAEQEM